MDLDIQRIYNNIIHTTYSIQMPHTNLCGILWVVFDSNFFSPKKTEVFFKGELSRLVTLGCKNEMSINVINPNYEILNQNLFRLKY